MYKFKLLRILENERFLAFFIFLITFLIRIPFFVSVKSDPAFIMPVVDNLEFDVWGCDILQGNLWWSQLHNHPPLYAYFLAAIYKIFGYGTGHVALLQYLVASAGSVLVYLIARRLTNKATAVICAIFMATYWFFIYMQSFLFSENLSLFLNVLLIYLLLYLKDSSRKYLLAGIIFGLSIICRADLLLFALFILAWLILKKIPFEKIVKFYLLFIAGFILMLSPVIMRNYAISGEMPLIRTQVGANLYMGNISNYKGSSINIGIGKDWEDFISLPHRALKREVKEFESNRFFVGETLKVIKQSPSQWLKLTFGKIFSVLSGKDLLTSEDAYFYDKYIAKDFTGIISTRMIFILAAAGMILSFQFFRQFLLIYLFIAAEMLIVFFQVKTRYFMPVVPFFLIFSSYALYRLYEALKQRNWNLSLAIIATVCSFNLLSFYNPLGIRQPDISETYFAIAKNYDARAKFNKAAEYYARAIKVNPQYVSAYNDLGVLFLNSADYEKALRLFGKALSIDKDAIKPKLNYQLCQELMLKNKKSK